MNPPSLSSLFSEYFEVIEESEEKIPRQFHRNYTKFAIKNP